MIGTGVVAGAMMDMIGTGIAYSGKKSIIRRYAISIETIGWVVVGCATFYVLYLVRDGAWRMYDPFAQICGMLLYINLFYRPFRFIGRTINLILIKPLLWILFSIFAVIRQMIRIVLKILYFLLRPFIKLFGSKIKNTFKKKKNDL
ncbi:hypothetical protein AU377_13950 [Sporosarcina sp. HYO08]|nr:spore cortex biosynthesis protein YabQ [Sporosarcina sp. HYO08]KXH86818.1 hypothetical protein AU377_13950 [Sporosarcina sp. HYO08]